MKCPHCRISFHENWSTSYVDFHNRHAGGLGYRVAHCPSCKEFTIEIGQILSGEPLLPWRQVVPEDSVRTPPSQEVPLPIAADYREACLTLPISPKASAALSRRCLQHILRSKGYHDKDLAKEIDLFLKEPDPAKAIPASLRGTVDAIRNFGNFSAHPINDLTTLQVIEVEPEEAEWCLEIIEAMFDHFYVQPAVAAAKKAALDAKLAAAGKPPSKA